MESQSLSNHVRLHPLYHYFAVPLSLILVLASLTNLFFYFSLEAILLFISMIILHFSLFLARDYAKKNQDRIIRSELRLRYFQLTNKRLEEIEHQFTIGQLLALRFASDEEFIQLLQHPETPKKKPIDIKHQIIQWNADWMRV